MSTHELIRKGTSIYVGFNWDTTIRELVKPIDKEIYQRVVIILSRNEVKVIKRVIPKIETMNGAGI